MHALITAEVNVNGAWQKVNIVDKESEYLYKVHYQGKSDNDDEWVSVSQIKNIDSATKPAFKPAEIKMASAANCSFTPPVAAVSNAEKFSEKLAKRKIYELLAFHHSAGKKTGVSYLYFQEAQAYINEVSFSSTHSLIMKNSAAPAGAMIYPVKVKYRLCTQSGNNTTTQIIDGNFSCYRNSKGLWECAADSSL